MPPLAAQPTGAVAPPAAAGAVVASIATEIGFQPASRHGILRGISRPWIRAGWFRRSGDDDPTNRRHGTFFQVLPTPRVHAHARMPSYNLMNIEDVCGSLSLRALTLSSCAANADARAVAARIFPGEAGRLFNLEAELRR